MAMAYRGRWAAPVLVVALAACADRREPAPVVFRGSDPVAPAAPAAEPLAPPPSLAATPDAAGIVDYGGYRAMIARDGDTVESMAARAGLSGTALAAYNGLPTGHVPRAGDELILPPDAPTQVAVASPAVAAAPLDPAVASDAQASQRSGFDLDSIGQSLEDPAPGATAPPPAEPATPTPSAEVAAAPTAAAPPEQAPRPAEAAITPPPAPTTVAAAPAASSARFVRPVEGTVARPFSRAAGPARSDGMSFAAPAGSRVVAVDDGQVALVSEALGGDLGTVVLIRHGGQLLTVYGRVEPSVTQGDRVSRGQIIGTVAAPADGDPSMHFEVRRGTEPVDPQPFFES